MTKKKKKYLYVFCVSQRVKFNILMQKYCDIYLFNQLPL